MLVIKRTVERTPTEAPRFTVLTPAPEPCPGRVALAMDAPLDVAAGVLLGRGLTTAEALEVLGRAADDGEATHGGDEPRDVVLPHPDDVQVASRWVAVNRFRDAYEAALSAPAWDREYAEAEAERCERAAVRVAPDAAERVCLSAEVRRLRWARELQHPDALWR